MRSNPSPRTLRERERELLAFITLHTACEGRAPSLSEIQHHLKLKSKHTATRLVDRMTRSGAIARNDTRAFGSRSGELQVVHAQSFPNFN